MVSESAESLEHRAEDLERRVHHTSGRAAQLAAQSDTLQEDIRYVQSAVAQLERDATAANSERVLRRTEAVQAVLSGSGPGGDLLARLEGPRKGRFLTLMLGSEANVQSDGKAEERLRLKEAYHSFRDLTDPLFALLPALLLLASHSSFVSSSLYILLAQMYCVFLLWFYSSLSLRENVLRCNGSSIRPWWVRHHYYGVFLALSALSMPAQNYMSRKAFFDPYCQLAFAQGLVMLLQNRYQRRRMYTRVALGKSSSMDVVSSGISGQLKLLYPLLFFLQVLYLRSSFLCLAASTSTLGKYVYSTSQIYKRISTMSEKVSQWIERTAAHNAPPWQVSHCGILLLLMAGGNTLSLLSTIHEKASIKRGRKQRRTSNSKDSKVTS
jgi:hypothetical protein